MKSFHEWLITEKYMNDHSAICEHCHSPLIADRIVKNPKHIYDIGQLRECDCGKSKIWTNSVRNEKSLLAFFRGEKNTWGETKYTHGFCNDKYCGYCFGYIQPLKNGVRYRGESLDRYGCERCPQNQNILLDLRKEDKEGTPEWLIEWYRERKEQLEMAGE
jgi:hypothetical protein